MITVEVQLRERTFAAVFKLAEARGMSVGEMVEGALFAMSWEEPTTFFQREVTRMHSEGATIPWIAAVLNVPNNRVQVEMRKQGLRANRVVKAKSGYERKANR